jgi:hypothetical protein
MLRKADSSSAPKQIRERGRWFPSVSTQEKAPPKRGQVYGCQLAEGGYGLPQRDNAAIRGAGAGSLATNTRHQSVATEQHSYRTPFVPAANQLEKEVRGIGFKGQVTAIIRSFGLAIASGAVACACPKPGMAVGASEGPISGSGSQHWAPRATVERAFLNYKKAPPKRGLSMQGGSEVCPPTPILKSTPMRRRYGPRHIPARVQKLKAGKRLLSHPPPIGRGVGGVHRIQSEKIKKQIRRLFLCFSLSFSCSTSQLSREARTPATAPAAAGQS